MKIILSLAVLVLAGCQQQQPTQQRTTAVTAECECEHCRCKEPCNCGTIARSQTDPAERIDHVAIRASLDRLREDVNGLRSGVAKLESDRPAVSGGSVRNAQAQQEPRGYTGIAVYVAETEATLQGRSTCEPCNRLVRDVRAFGNNWRIGGLTDHFAIMQADVTDTTPLLIAYRDGVELWRETGYSGDIDSLIRRNPRVDRRSLVNQQSTVRSSSAIAEGVPLSSVYTGGSSFSYSMPVYSTAPVVTYSSPVTTTYTYAEPAYAAPVYTAPVYTAPAYRWGFGFGRATQCVNGVCW